jgi:2-amino-4-hydroxy-6-hydroxymethyldihydropteridine diphosphokinase
VNQRYVIALGSNAPHHRHGSPPCVLRAALHALDARGIAIVEASPIVSSRPIGPSRRCYANAAAAVATALGPDAMLDALKAVERSFGRRAGGQRWTTRVLDLDIVLWDGGAWQSPGLTVPHIAFRRRAFVLAPAARIAPNWRDPLSGLTLRQLLARLGKPKRQP